MQKLIKKIGPTAPNFKKYSLFYFKFSDTAQKLKFSIEDFLSNVNKSAVSCGFGYIY